ncbi:hypothetical protein ElyMa_006380900 [Elysia marginata]|uniref:Shugoshin C-terminal domain-containing protein n=1 Tax=Elysia marginata TaxID=1093978 RepID=A0AAV4HQU6_9GAST|nr:hypothetical protein ElyMa_006380900 [Elysia marginata]
MHLEQRRAKSVPLHGLDTARLEGVDEENEDEIISEDAQAADTHLKITEPPVHGILRPTTSILRPSQQVNGLSPADKDDTLRPKTTNSRRRVALDTFIQQDSLPSVKAIRDISQDNGSASGKIDDGSVNLDSGPPSQRSTKGEKGERERRRTISINECPQVVDSSQQGPQSPRPRPASLVQSRAAGERADLEDRMPGLAATRIATNNGEDVGDLKPLKTKKTQGVAKKLNSVQAGTVIFPKVKQVVPELGTDSPRQL